MRKIVVMTMIEGAKLSAIETLNKYCERDEELKKVVDCQGGVIIYPVHKPFNERFYNEDECKWEGNPGIPYELVGQIFKEFGAKQSDHILYPGFDFARTRKAEFIKPSEEWLKRFKDRDQLFAFENMKSFAEHGLVVLEFSSLIDRTVFGKHDQYITGIIFSPDRCYSCDQDYELEVSKKIADDICKSRNLKSLTIGHLTTIDLRDILKEPYIPVGSDENLTHIAKKTITPESTYSNLDMKDWDMDRIKKAMGVKFGFFEGLNDRSVQYYIKPPIINDITNSQPDNLLLTICVRISDNEFNEVKDIFKDAPTLAKFVQDLSYDYLSNIVLSKINTKKYIHNSMCFMS